MSDTHALPKYVQISELLIRDIQAGRLADGERLPPERDMAARLGISVGTLRKSLDELTALGLLDRVQGSGNYVCAQEDTQSVYAFFRVELIEGGGLPTAELLSVDRLPKPKGLPPFGQAADGHRIRRLRRLNGIPAVLEEIWLDGSYIDQIDAVALRESLYLYYRETLGLWITKAEDRLDLAEVPDWAPGAFGCDVGQPCMRATRISYGPEAEAAEASWNWINTDVARYVARIT
ncbi:GntR family transcriptional regulator [Marivita sp. XM-24bin2]|uniref:GntR family transcriptional regulator n=1 Tax=unclassified Marivita TaxID=2632480 RepID=UPI000D7A6EFB|nr:GntR family transcriptional regulator [Marivita sp. XM-24bin2]MCR9109485.1 GntR family transcriptional regulator [Paracoccaceae bacterium]PWL35743.1 MAG: GntR family transcriptional regulator [Marivita sp. XM-24bin2]